MSFFYYIFARHNFIPKNFFMPLNSKKTNYLYVNGDEYVRSETEQNKRRVGLSISMSPEEETELKNTAYGRRSTISELVRSYCFPKFEANPAGLLSEAIAKLTEIQERCNLQFVDLDENLEELEYEKTENLQKNEFLDEDFFNTLFFNFKAMNLESARQSLQDMQKYDKRQFLSYILACGLLRMYNQNNLTKLVNLEKEAILEFCKTENINWDTV